MIALVDGEATVLGTVGSGDRQQQEITTIQADVAELGTVVANKASIADLNAQTARINTLETSKANVADLEANYAKLDATNVGTATIRDAWITALLVQSGLLAQTGTIYTLDAIQVNADRITAGTIDVQRLVVTVNGHKYLVQFDAQGNPTYVKLDGDAIQDLTITADKLVANTITTNQIT